MADRKSQRAAARARRAPAPPAAARPAPGFPLPTRRVAIVLAILTLVFFYQVMLLGRTFVAPDAIQPAGFVRVGEESLWKEHTYPLWNPLVFLGMPSFGSGAYNPLIYPPDWPLGAIQKVVPLPDQTWLVLYYFLGALFMFLLAREWGAAAEGALIGAVAFVFAPNLIAVGTHGHGSQLVDSAYTPLLLWLATRWMRRGRLPDLAWLALAGGFQILRGHVQICFYTWLAVGLYGVVECLVPAPAAGESGAAAAGARPDRRTALIRLAGLGAAAALAFGISAFYSLPLRDYARYSIRGAQGGGVGMEYATAWSLAPYELPEMVVPGWVGFGGATYWGGMPFTDYPNAHVGMVAVLLLLPAFVAGAGARAPRLFAVALALLAILVAFGSHFPLYAFLYDHLPLFNKFRVPVMIVLLLQVAVAAGGAWGWSALIEPRPGGAARVTRVLLGSGIALLAALLIGLAGRAAWQAAYIQTAVAAKGHLLHLSGENFDAGAAAGAWAECSTSFVRACLIGLAAVAIGWFARGGRQRAAATLGLLALVLIELWPVSTRVMAPVIGERVARPLDVGRDDAIDFLEHAGPPGSFRIVPFDELQSNRFATFGIASVTGYHAAKTQLYQEFNQRRGYLMPAWLRLLNVRYVVVQQPYQQVPAYLKVVHQGASEVLEFIPWLPRVTVIGRYRVISPGYSILDSIGAGGIDSGTMTLLERDPGLTLGPVEGATATIESYRLNDVSIAVDTPGAALVRLADLWYPDWVASVDGRPAEIIKADYLLRAVAVPAGHHRIEFHYRSKAVRDGLAVSLASLLIAVLGVAGPPLLRRWRAGRPRAAAAAPTG